MYLFLRDSTRCMETTILFIFILSAFAGWVIAWLQEAHAQQEALVDIGFGMVAAGIAGIVVIGLRIAGFFSTACYCLRSVFFFFSVSWCAPTENCSARRED